MGAQFMLYGANGYTGSLTAARAIQLGLKPVIAGRNEGAIKALAQKLDLPYRIFDLTDLKASREALQDIDAVLHMAGPFSATSVPMFEACLDTGTHYLDITGEISVFETLFNRNTDAVKAGITAIPGVGFDVVPTDCISAFLKEQLPDATHLELAFGGSGSASPGTMKTMVEGLGLGSAARVNGVISHIPSGTTVKTIPFADKERHGVAIPWGDVSTAFHSTAIPNITVYMAMPQKAVKFMKATDLAGPLLQICPAQKVLKKIVEWRVKGPDEEQRGRGVAQLWGQAKNAAGTTVTVTMTAPEGYTLTVESSLEAVQRVLSGDIEPGVQTPSKAFGWQFAETLDNVVLHQPATT